MLALDPHSGPSGHLFPIDGGDKTLPLRRCQSFTLASSPVDRERGAKRSDAAWGSKDYLIRPMLLVRSL